MRGVSSGVCLMVVVSFGHLACWATTSDDASFTFTAVVHDVASPITQRVDPDSFMDLFEGLTDGEVVFDLVPVGQYCRDSADCLDRLKSGDIDLFRATVADLAGLFPELQVLAIPYLVESAAVAELVYSGAFFARMRDALLERTGLRLMAVSSVRGWRHIANDVRVVRVPEDLEGMQIATLDVPVHFETTRAIGAEPSVMQPSNTGHAQLAESTGLRGSVTDLLALEDSVRPKFLTLDRHNYIVELWLMNERSYRNMPLDLQQIVQLGFDELRRLTLRFSDEAEDNALVAYRAAGGETYEVTREQHRAFVMAAGRVSTWYMDEYGYDWFVWFEGAIAEAERELLRVRPR